MKKILTLICVASLALGSEAKDNVTLTSPDGTLKVAIETAGDTLHYSVWEGDLAHGHVYALRNGAALCVEGIGTKGYSAVSKPRHVEERFDAPNYKFAQFGDEYNQVVAKGRGGINVEFRAYNSGVAYRFVMSKARGEWKVTDEVAEFNFAADHTAYLPHSTNGKNPKAMAFQATYDVAPLSQSKPLEAFLPATVDCGGAKVTILETDVQSYPGMFLLPGNNNDVLGLRADFARCPKAFDYYPWRMQKYVTDTEDYIARGTGNRAFPWRILAITHQDREMPVNTLSYQLAEPSRIAGNADWIRPGKVAWDWWNDWGISGVDFEAGINQATYKYYIDFASSQGLEYVVLDEGWYNPKSGDMLTVIPDLDLPALVEYGRQKGVGIILWTVFNVLDAQLDAACRRYAEMGIKGFKVDFLDRYDQEAVDMIYRIAARCAESHLLLDYHGIFAPQGIQRTYPNVINFEAVFGMEEVKWTEREKGTENGRRYDRPSKDMPQYDVTFPFIRGMAGYVDFTPGGMRNATRADFQPIYNNPLTMGTRCHQLAHYIVHESQLTMLADNPTAYLKEQQCTDFITSLPTVFDHMEVVDGRMGHYIVVARSKGRDWYVAGETNWEARTLQLSLDFLPEGSYEMLLFRDGVNADKVATDYTTQRLSITTPSSAPLTLRMASGGGFAAKILRLK